MNQLDVQIIGEETIPERKWSFLDQMAASLPKGKALRLTFPKGVSHKGAMKHWGRLRGKGYPHASSHEQKQPDGSFIVYLKLGKE